MEPTSCDHRRTVEDEQSASEVCIECGLVLAERIIPIRQYWEEIKNMPPVGCTVDESRLREDILNMLALFDQDNPFMADEVYSFLRRTVNLHEHRKPGVKAGYLAFALWETLSRHGRAYSPMQIARKTEIPIQRMREAERELEVAPHFCPPSLFSHRMCAALDLDYPPLQMLVHRAAIIMDDYVHKPEVVVGAIIYYLGRSIQSHHGIDLPHTHLKTLADVLGVSSQAIKHFQLSACYKTIEAGRARLALEPLHEICVSPAVFKKKN